MESLVMDLLETLRRQDETLAGLIAAAREHTAAMAQNDPAFILSVVKKNESLINQLKRQDAEREEIEKQIAEKMKVEEPITLNRLLELMDGSQAKTELRQVAEELKAKLNELFEINKLNSVMAKHGLLYAEQLRNIIQPKTGTTYQGTGCVREQKATISTMNKSI
ncbi:flagellar protein FlgN [Desulforamulus ruminis]|nr:flagellar protein FlgN [Desulforamulus ruminis]